MNSEPKEMLIRRMLLHSAEDLSVLEAALKQTADTNILSTSPGSRNDQLWSTFCEHGWMARDAVDTLAGIPSRLYRMLPEGRAPIADLLQSLPAARVRRSDAMVAIANDLCADFAQSVVSRAKSEGGDAVDVLLLLSDAVARTIVLSVDPSKHAEALERVARSSKERLAQLATRPQK